MQEIIHKITFFLNIDELSLLFREIIQYVSNFFSEILYNAPWVFWIYLITIILLLLLSNKIYKNFLSSKSICLHDIDKILYKIALLIQKEKENIHDFPNTIKILYNNQKKILTDKNSSFISNFDDLLKDVHYIEQLLQTTIIKQEQIDKINSLIDIIKKNRMLYLWLMSLVAIITLWIWNFLQKNTKI